MLPAVIVIALAAVVFVSLAIWGMLADDSREPTCWYSIDDEPQEGTDP